MKKVIWNTPDTSRLKISDNAYTAKGRKNNCLNIDIYIREHFPVGQTKFIMAPSLAATFYKKSIIKYACSRIPFQLVATCIYFIASLNYCKRKL